MIPFDRHEEVQSSNLKEIGTVDDYLVVVFQNGATYRYPGLAHMMDDVIGAESVGRYFAQHVRNQPCERLRPEEWPEEID